MFAATPFRKLSHLMYARRRFALSVVRAHHLFSTLLGFNDSEQDKYKNINLGQVV